MDGLIALMNGNYSLPVNIGNPDEYTVKVRYMLIVLPILAYINIIYSNLLI